LAQVHAQAQSEEVAFFLLLYPHLQAAQPVLFLLQAQLFVVQTLLQAE
jgi:hypothetical protein